MAIGLVGISGQQVQIRGHHPFADPGSLSHQIPEAVLQGVVFLFDFRQHGTGDGDFLVVGQLLSHVVKPQEHRVFQQKPRIHDRRDPRQEPFPHLALLFGFRCGIVLFGILFVHFFQHPVLQAEIPGAFVRLVIQQHQASLQPEQQIEDAFGVPVDEGGGHAEHFVGDPGQFRHGLPLGALAAVLVQLVHDERVDPPHLSLEIG